MSFDSKHQAMKQVKALLFNKLIVIGFSIVLGFVLTACEDEVETDDNSDNANQVTIEALTDGDFENWNIHTEGEVSYEVPESGWWGSLNMLATLGSPLTMTKTGDAHSGNYAVQLETKNWGDQLAIPGILAAGYFDTSQPIAENLMLGRPYSETPVVLSGYFKYFPADQDTLVIYTNLTRYNTETNTRDTIAEADFTIDQLFNEYTKFELFYDYYLTGVTPDTINVLFLTSVSGQEFLGHIGSKLLIDDLTILLENEK